MVKRIKFPTLKVVGVMLGLVVVPLILITLFLYLKVILYGQNPFIYNSPSLEFLIYFILLDLDMYIQSYGHLKLHGFV